MSRTASTKKVSNPTTKYRDHMETRSRLIRPATQPGITELEIDPEKQTWLEWSVQLAPPPTVLSLRASIDISGLPAEDVDQNPKPMVDVVVMHPDTMTPISRGLV